MKHPFKQISRRPTLAVISCILLLCLLIAVGQVVLALPADWTLFDTSDLRLTELSSKSETFLQDIDRDVTIYWICKNGDMANAETLGMLAASYEDASDRIDVIMVDPVASPSFTSKYTSSALTNYSFIVESDLRYTIVDSADVFYYTNDYIDGLYGSTYRMTYEEFNSLYTSQSYGPTMAQYPSYEYFQGEALLTAAVDYVSLPALPHPYVMTGHGDDRMPETLTAMLGTFLEISAEEIDLQTKDAIPEAAACVILFDPQSDISAHEADLLKGYIKNGGSFVLVTSPSATGFENLASVTALFGLTAEEGLVTDPSENYHVEKDPLRLAPGVNKIDALTPLLSLGMLPYMPSSHSISIATTKPSGVTAAPLFATSGEAYRVSADGENTPLCDPASLYVGARATLTLSTPDGTVDTGDLVWFASAEAFTTESANLCSGSNYYYFCQLTGEISPTYTSPYTHMEGINLATPMLEDVASNTAIALGIIMVVIIPMGLVITGLAVWLKRRGR